MKPAAAGQSQRLGRGFPDAGSGTSTIQHCDVRHKEATVSDTTAQRRDWDRHLLDRKELSIVTRTKEARDVSVQERGGNTTVRSVFKTVHRNGKAGQKKKSFKLGLDN